MSDELVLTGPWRDLRRADHHSQGLLTQLHRELSPGHPLHDGALTVIGRSHTRDDILVARSSGGWAVVHLTWSRSAQTPPWPSCTFYDDAR